MSSFDNVNDLRVLAYRLYEAGIIMVKDPGRGESFRYKSGKIGPTYFDFRKLFSQPEVVDLIAQAYVAKVKASDELPDAILGIPYGSMAIATAVSDDMGIPLIYPAEPEEGQDFSDVERIVGYEPGMKVAMVDDVCTTAGTKLEVLQLGDKLGVDIQGCYVFIDYGVEHPARTEFTNRVEITPATTAVEMFKGIFLHDNGRSIDNELQAAIMDWLENGIESKPVKVEESGVANILQADPKQELVAEVVLPKLSEGMEPATEEYLAKGLNRLTTCVALGGLINLTGSGIKLGAIYDSLAITATLSRISKIPMIAKRTYDKGHGTNDQAVGTCEWGDTIVPVLLSIDDTEKVLATVEAFRGLTRPDHDPDAPGLYVNSIIALGGDNETTVRRLEQIGVRTINIANADVHKPVPKATERNRSRGNTNNQS